MAEETCDVRRSVRRGSAQLTMIVLLFASSCAVAGCRVPRGLPMPLATMYYAQETAMAATSLPQKGGDWGQCWHLSTARSCQTLTAESLRA